MNKIELIRCVADISTEEVTQKQVGAVLAALESVVRDAITENRDEKVTLSGLGTFSVKHVAERSGIAALAGGKAWTKPAHDEIQFKISKSFKNI